ncbi:MAG: hypothetical protein ACT6R6_18715 [Flavobacterium sp.]|uniref:hypothetical protein n=1 Tax=Flavobacterium sp. TaxID=239 RepID=UPI0040343F18
MRCGHAQQAGYWRAGLGGQQPAKRAKPVHDAWAQGEGASCFSPRPSMVHGSKRAVEQDHAEVQQSMGRRSLEQGLKVVDPDLGH